MERVPPNRAVGGLTFFVTATLTERKPRFADVRACELVLDSLAFFRKRSEIELYGFVIMPDHVHLVVKTSEATTLPVFVRRLKTFVAHELGDGAIWKKGYWSEVVADEKHLRQKLTYIHENPVRAGLVGQATDYTWSSASDYMLSTERSRIDSWRG
jgi:putative transposase